jgi:hypothetical protein
LKSKTMVCFAGCQLRPLTHRALEVEQVIEEHDPAPVKAGFGDLDLGGDGVALARMSGAALAGTPVSSPEYVKTVCPP